MSKKYKSFVFCLIIAGLILLWGSLAKAEMIKEVVWGLFLDAPSQVEADRFYFRYHAPETIRISGPWLRRYESFKPFTPPVEAVEKFGAIEGRYAELWYASEEEYLSRPNHGAWSLPSWETDKSRKMPKGAKVATTVPALPTDEFYDPDPNPEQTPIIRWVQAIKYPEGVSEEEGEKWLLEVHAKEALKQPGLLKFISHKCLSGGGSGAPPEMPEGGMPDISGTKHEWMAHPDMDPGEKPGSWVRIIEYWYEDFESWKRAVIDSPPEYTPPSWGGEYPFVEMKSTFIGYKPDVDFLKGNYIVP